MAEPAKKTSRRTRKSTASTEAKKLARVLDEGLFAMHFQPIVDLRSRAVFAYESLCRPERDYFKSPVALIDAAVKAERIGELGRLQRTKAVKGCGDHSLFVNRHLELEFDLADSALTYK